MAKTTGGKVLEAVISGSLSLALSTSIVYVISKGRYPNKETAGYFMPATFIAGILLYTGYEITGAHRKFCENLLK